MPQKSIFQQFKPVRASFDVGVRGQTPIPESKIEQNVSLDLYSSLYSHIT
jgi:hypothetical protein